VHGPATVDEQEDSSGQHAAQEHHGGDGSRTAVATPGAAIGVLHRNERTHARVAARREDAARPVSGIEPGSACGGSTRSIRRRHAFVIIARHDPCMASSEVDGMAPLAAAGVGVVPTEGVRPEGEPDATRRWRLRRHDGIVGWLGRRTWDTRAHSWEHEGSAAVRSVIEAVLDAAGARPGEVAVDLGCGSGQLSLPLARRGAAVTAVDVIPRMVELLRAKADDAGLSLVARVALMERLAFPPASLDLVVSNYALHHLHDREKLALVRTAATWLRPGGRMVVGDMMFGRGGTGRDREIIGAKVSVMLHRGPAGWWRLAKNVVRFGLRLRERPVSMETWVRYFEESGLTDVSVVPVVSEAAVVSGTKR
jgi:SAM-dependent methyltransferase